MMKNIKEKVLELAELLINNPKWLETLTEEYVETESKLESKQIKLLCDIIFNTLTYKSLEDLK